MQIFKIFKENFKINSDQVLVYYCFLYTITHKKCIQKDNVFIVLNIYAQQSMQKYSIHFIYILFDCFCRRALSHRRQRCPS